MTCRRKSTYFSVTKISRLTPFNKIIYLCFDPPPQRYSTPLPPVGHVLLIIDASWSHSDTPHSLRLLWTSDRSDTENSTLQKATLTTDSYPYQGRIRTRNPSKQAATDPRLRPRGHWDRLFVLTILRYPWVYCVGKIYCYWNWMEVTKYQPPCLRGVIRTAVIDRRCTSCRQNWNDSV